MDHECPADGCERRCPQHILACRSHWYRVSVPTRRALTAAWRGGISREYLAIRADAVAEMNDKKR